MEKELLEELKETKYQLDQYRLLTNKLINQNVSQYNIDKFVEEEYIQNIYKHVEDYDYDLYNWLSPDLLDEVSNELIRLETQLKKQKEINKKVVEYINICLRDIEVNKDYPINKNDLYYILQILEDEEDE